MSSGVTIASYLTYRYHVPVDIVPWTRLDSWVFLVPIISAVISFLGIGSSVCQCYKDENAVCKFESVCVWAVTSIWTVGTVVIQLGPFREDSDARGVSLINLHPNLYFFSMSALVVAILLMASWFHENVQGTNQQSASTQWILLGAISFFTLISGIDFRDDNVILVANSTLLNGTHVNVTQTVPVCTTGVYECGRVTFAIVLSAISATVACLVTPWKGASRKCQSDVSIMLFFGWLVGVGLITFGGGPGKSWGNLYFACNVCMFLCLHLVIVSTCGDEKTDNVGYGEARRGDENVVDRNAVWDVAYEQLEHRVGQLEHRVGRHLRKERNRSDSYANLFAPPSRWTDGSHQGSIDDSDESQQYTDVKYRINQLYRLELWCVLIIESIINLIALRRELPPSGQRHVLELWALAAPSLSIVVGFCGFSTVLRTTTRSKVIQAFSVSRENISEAGPQV
jgi:hypothetical protein